MADRLRPYNADQSFAVSDNGRNLEDVDDEGGIIASTSENNLQPISSRLRSKSPGSLPASSLSSPNVSSAGHSESSVTPLISRAQSEGHGESNYRYAIMLFAAAELSGHKLVAEPPPCSLPSGSGPRVPGPRKKTIRNSRSPYRNSPKMGGLAKRETTPDTFGVNPLSGSHATSSTSPPGLETPPSTSTTPSTTHPRSISHSTTSSDKALLASTPSATAECPPSPQARRPSEDKTPTPPLLDSEKKQRNISLSLPPSIAPIDERYWSRETLKWKTLPLVVQKTWSHTWKIPLESVPIMMELIRILTETMTEKKRDMRGEVYVFKVVEGSQYQGLVKIGRTSSDPSRRKKDHYKCYSSCKFVFPVMNEDKTKNILHHDLVESLVHTELAPWRHRLNQCPGSKETRHGFHSEWFSIDEAHAIAVIKKWRDWMEKFDPFAEGVSTNKKGQKKTGGHFRPDISTDEIFKICTPMFHLLPSAGVVEDKQLSEMEDLLQGITIDE